MDSIIANINTLFLFLIIYEKIFLSAYRAVRAQKKGLVEGDRALCLYIIRFIFLEPFMSVTIWLLHRIRKRKSRS